MVVKSILHIFAQTSTFWQFLLPGNNHPNHLINWRSDQILFQQGFVNGLQYLSFSLSHLIRVSVKLYACEIVDGNVDASEKWRWSRQIFSFIYSSINSSKSSKSFWNCLEPSGHYVIFEMSQRSTRELRCRHLCEKVQDALNHHFPHQKWKKRTFDRLV